jgi:glycosyltransferase involved in cell wall biosynthesis
MLQKLPSPATETRDWQNSNLPNILVISPAFVPSYDSEAFCSAKLVAALAGVGTGITVFTYHEFAPQLVDGSASWQALRKYVADFPVPTHRNPMQSLSSAVRYQTQQYARWTGAAVEEAKRIHSLRPFDLVYSRSLPMFSHIAGYWCAKNLRLPWIAGINDPWDWHLFPVKVANRVPIPRSLSTFWMKRTFRGANLLIYPNTRLHAYHEKISGIRHDSLIIPHVGTVRNQTTQPGAPSKIFTLVHAGKLGSSEATGRSAVHLLHGLRLFLADFPEAANITKLMLVGPSDAKTESIVSDLQLETIVSATGRVTYEESQTIIQAAAVCVLIEADMKEGIFLPSKLVDYLSAGKPVLALSPRVGVINDMAEQFGILRVDTEDVEGVRRAIGNLYLNFRNHSLASVAPCRKQINQFEPKNIAGMFLTAICRLAHPEKIHSRATPGARAPEISGVRIE